MHFAVKTKPYNVPAKRQLARSKSVCLSFGDVMKFRAKNRMKRTLGSTRALERMGGETHTALLCDV